MGKEFKYKLIILAAVLIFVTAGFLAVFWGNFNLIIILIIIGFAAVFLSIIEAYLRVQHNVEKKFRDFLDFRKLFSEEIDKITENTDSENNSKGTDDPVKELDKKFFMLKNDLEFKILNFKLDIEKKLNSIIDTLKKQ